MTTHAFVTNLRRQAAKALLQLSPALRRIESRAQGFPHPDKIRQRQSLREKGIEWLPSAFTHEIIRILPFWQQCKAKRFARLNGRKRNVGGAPCSAQTSIVSVETKNRFARHPPQQLELVLRQRRAQGGYRI